MLKNLKYQFRSLAKHRSTSIISIGGFALSGAIVLLLLAFISAERSYDKDIPDVDNIYRIIANGNISDIPEDAARIIKEQVPGIQAISNYYVGYKPVIYKNKSFPSKMICTDNEIFNILGTKLIAGSIDNFHKIPEEVVLTESFAKTIFKEENPIGQIINLSHRKDAIVMAIIKDFPENRSFNGQVFCSNKLKITYTQRGWQGKSTYFDKVLVKLADNASIKNIEKQLKPLINNLFHFYAEADYNYSLSPLKNAYFIHVKYDGLNHANVKLIDLLSWLALIILVFAIFNYVNFSVAKISTEFKNIGMHQVLGASRFKLFRIFIFEALFQLTISMVLAVALIYAIKPLIEGILGQEIVFNILLTNIPLITTIVLSVLLIAVLAGSYPAYIAMKAKPGTMLKNKIVDLQKQRDIRMPLNVIQFAASIIAVVSLITIQRQIEFAKNKELGFSTEQLVRISVHNRIKEHVPALMDKIGSVPGVKDICPTHGTPWAIYSYSENNEFGKFSEIRSNSHFLETFNIKLIDGRNFFPGEQSTKALINQKGLKQAGWGSFKGKKLFGCEVVGIIEDFNYEDLHNEVGALLIRNEEGLSHLNVRLYPGDISNTMKLVEKEFNKIADNFNFEYQFYDEWMDTMYKKEEKQAEAIQLISVVAMLLAILGMLGLAGYALKRRIKEIGIRKVNGGKISEILVLLNKDFIKWIGIAFVIATPISYFAMNKWLENFAYKTELSWWIFVLAGVIALVIAMVTVSYQSWRAASRNPVEALRYE